MNKPKSYSWLERAKIESVCFDSLPPGSVFYCRFLSRQSKVTFISVYTYYMHQFPCSCIISLLTRPILSSFSSYSLATSRISKAPLWTYYLVTRPILSGKHSASFWKKSLPQPSKGNLHGFLGLFGTYSGHMSQFWDCFFLYKVGFPWTPYAFGAHLHSPAAGRTAVLQRNG